MKNLIDRKILYLDLWENKQKDYGKLGSNIKIKNE